jgi:hypothetical protein
VFKKDSGSGKAGPSSGAKYKLSGVCKVNGDLCPQKRINSKVGRNVKIKYKKGEENKEIVCKIK